VIIEGGLAAGGRGDANKRGGKPGNKRLAHGFLPDDAFDALYVCDLSAFSGVCTAPHSSKSEAMPPCGRAA
jgi:hypothetical protein